MVKEITTFSRTMHRETTEVTVLADCQEKNLLEKNRP